jgi:hypothetical protein
VRERVSERERECVCEREREREREHECTQLLTSVSRHILHSEIAKGSRNPKKMSFDVGGSKWKAAFGVFETLRRPSTSSVDLKKK